jgi:hypothetical protein
LNRGISNEGRPAAPGASGNVRVNQPVFTSFNTGGGAAQSGSSTTRVQMAAKTGLVKVAGFDVTEEVAATLAETAPQLTVPEAEKVAAAKAEETSAVKEEADRAELNRFVDDAAEGVAMHISNEVDFGDQVRLLHELHTTGTVSTSTLNRFADQLHMSVDETVAALNAVHMNTSLQVATLCKVAGVDAQAFNTYMKTHHSTEMFKALQVHSQERDMQRAWSGHIAAFKARGQR